MLSSTKQPTKGRFWYNPTQFKTLGTQLPATWSDLIALSDKIASSGKYPWSMGVESGAASGWPAADWVAEIYLNQSGPELYDQWVAHKISWTHPSIKSAFQSFGQIVGGKHYINGAPKSVLATGFHNASYAPFTFPPQSCMYYLGDLRQGLSRVNSPTPNQELTLISLLFPTINTQYQGAVTGGADVIVAMKDTEAVRKLITYLATADAQTIWVKRGGFTSPNKSVNLTAYPEPGRSGFS